MLASGSQLTVYSDSPALQGNVKSMTYKRKVNVTIPQNGGVVIVAQAK
jgi:hypothetical protein